MADVTLTVSGLTFTFNEGDVEQVGESINGTPEQTEISSTGSMGAYCYDYNGVKKVIKIGGYLTAAASTRIAGYTITSIYAQKQWLESLLNGAQTPLTFGSTYSTQSVLTSTGATPPYIGTFTNTKCKVETLSFMEVSGDPLRLKFEMTFLVGS